MKIRNERHVQMLKEAVARCSGYVALVDTASGKEYDLKNSEVQTEAYARLVLDETETMELFVSRREDRKIAYGFMRRLMAERMSA